jgi:ketosteroid isomerase-like protein
MSQENVEAVWNAYAAFNEGDLAGVLSWFHPDAVYRDAIHQAVEGEAGAFRGYASYEAFEIEPAEILDLGHGVALGSVIQRARLVGTSGDVRHRSAAVVVWVGA